MEIQKDCVVSFHYRLSNSDGTELETSRNGDPVAYLHGHRGVIRGLEEAMTGKRQGDVFTAEVPASKAYGARKEGSSQRVPIKHLLTKGRLKPGMAVKINTDNGPRDVTIVKVGKFNVDVDANHPLAGIDLSFDIEIVEVRAASSEELSHGHAHGVGGHQH